MKKLTSFVVCALACASIFAQPAQAASLNSGGRVAFVGVVDSGYGANTTSVTFQGVTSLGNCATFLGVVYFRMRDDLHGQQMYAMALAAAASGSRLNVNVDDTARDSGGFCFVASMNFVGN